MKKIYILILVLIIIYIIFEEPDIDKFSTNNNTLNKFNLKQNGKRCSIVSTDESNCNILMNKISEYDNLNDCHTNCLDDVNCNYISFNSNTNKCYLTKKCNEEINSTNFKVYEKDQELLAREEAQRKAEADAAAKALLEPDPDRSFVPEGFYYIKRGNEYFGNKHGTNITNTSSWLSFTTDKNSANAWKIIPEKVIVKDDQGQEKTITLYTIINAYYHAGRRLSTLSRNGIGKKDERATWVASDKEIKSLWQMTALFNQDREPIWLIYSTYSSVEQQSAGWHLNKDKESGKAMVSLIPGYVPWTIERITDPKWVWAYTALENHHYPQVSNKNFENVLKTYESKKNESKSGSNNNCQTCNNIMKGLAPAIEIIYNSIVKKTMITDVIYDYALKKIPEKIIETEFLNLAKYCVSILQNTTDLKNITGSNNNNNENIEILNILAIKILEKAIGIPYAKWKKRTFYGENYTKKDFAHTLIKTTLTVLSQWAVMQNTKCDIKDFDKCWFEIQFKDVYKLIGDVAGKAGDAVGKFLIENETARDVGNAVNNDPVIRNAFERLFISWFGNI